MALQFSSHGGGVRIDRSPQPAYDGTLSLCTTFGLSLPPLARLVVLHSIALCCRHWKLQLFAVGLCTAGVGIAIYLTEQAGWVHFQSTHAIVGGVTFIFVVMQSVGAASRPKLDDVGRATWSLWHKWNGRVTLGLAVAAIALGAIQVRRRCAVSACCGGDAVLWRSRCAVAVMVCCGGVLWRRAVTV